MLKDSGKREEFSTGAVRNTQENKGRCDLLPLDCLEMGDYFEDAEFLSYLNDFKNSGDKKYIQAAIRHFIHHYFSNNETAYLELAIHYEERANKYGDNNWQKGLPISRYLSSTIRHYLKFRRGDTDEPHNRAILWNLTAILWTCKHIPELNDYK